MGAMRLGVLDVGSNTVHLLVVDAHRGARPLPASSAKRELRLAESLDEAGRISDAGAAALVDAVAAFQERAEALGVHELLGFVTSAVREAANADDVLARVAEATGVKLEVLPGREEAKLTFLAARRWYGWSAGQLLVLDIGGGSLEVATGLDESPSAAFSVPLGAGRLTRDWLRRDPPTAEERRALWRFVRAEIAEQVRPITLAGQADLVVGTSKTIRSVARVAGAAPYGEGPYVERILTRDAAAEVVELVAGMPAAARAKLPGVSPGRAGQLLAGAMVVEAAMDLLDLAKMAVCPWALREGVILDRLDRLT